MQLMVIEYARHVMKLDRANSTEFDESSPHPMVIFMPEINQLEMGGTMRLGARETTIQTRFTEAPQNITLASQVYGITKDSNTPLPEQFDVLERHRHRYEVNPERVAAVEAAGLKFTGRGDQGVRMEIAELPKEVHPFYFGTQFHPEFKSRPNRPSPPFYAFAAAAMNKYEQLSRAGVMWQEYEAAIEAERSIVSPMSSGRKRTLSTATIESAHSTGSKLQRGNSLTHGSSAL